MLAHDIYKSYSFNNKRAPTACVGLVARLEECRLVANQDGAGFKCLLVSEWAWLLYIIQRSVVVVQNGMNIYF